VCPLWVEGRQYDKNFVLDTNVLLHDSNAIYAFEDNNVCIPIYVMEEIDKFKRDQTELGRNARQIARDLDRLRKGGNLNEGVPLNGEGKIRVIFAHQSLDSRFVVGNEMDDKILTSAVELKDLEEGCPTIFVSKDINLRIRADALGLQAVDYDKERIDISELYSGHQKITVSPDKIKELYDQGNFDYENELYPNQFLTLWEQDRECASAIARYNKKMKRVEKLIPTDKIGVWGIKPRNREQNFAFDLLLRDDIKLVSLIGKAGTGKTLIALAAALQKVIEEQAYERLLVSRPVIPMGKDIGFLPGDIEDKMKPWVRPIYDNLEFLMHMKLLDGSRKTPRINDFFDQDYIQVEPLTYIRGRSIPKQLIIIDEAQNLTPHELKTVITRVGTDSKVILTGDPYQIDNPYLDSVNNGLSTVVQKFKAVDISGTVTLMKGERSPISEIAAQLL